MCILHHRPDLQEYGELDDLEPVPRSCPRLAWAVPVDAAQLGASLETFEALAPQVNTLRLCHRFGHVPLSTLPQEILDSVLGLLYRSTREASVKRWNEAFRCFQGRCRSFDHLQMDDEEIAGVWKGTIPYQEIPCCERHRREGSFDEANFGIEEKREMVEDFINECGDWAEDSIDEMHDQAREQWLEMLCLCKDWPHDPRFTKTFLPFQEILKSNFGLEATFLHETLSANMIRFLPDAAHGPAHYGWYTSCFLGVSRKLTGDAVPPRRTEQYGNQAFLRNNIHLAFHQKVDLMALSINEEEVLSFSRALRMLDMEPSFHLTELETRLATFTGDDALSRISDAHLDGWPPVSKVPIHEKKEALETYLKQRNDEVRTQQWPQLMLMATSDAVAPIPISE